MPNPNQISLNVIVNGKPTPLIVNVNQPLHVVMKDALGESGNSGQPLANWELRDAAGQILDPDKKVEDYGLTTGTNVFLNLKAGVGGAR